MKKYFAILLFAVAFGLCVPSANAQASGTVKGVCKGVDGSLMGDAVVLWTNTDNGQKYQLKTNKKGEFFSLGLTPGKYTISLYKTPDDFKAAKELDHVKGFQVNLDENTLDFDEKKNAADQAQGKGLSAEDQKKMQEAQAKASKETNTVKSLNEKITAARTAAAAGDYETAIAEMTAATQMDANRDVIWFYLGDYDRLSVPKQTDPAEKQKRLEGSIEAYQKAIDLKKAVQNDKDPKAAQNLAGYYNNLADAYSKSKKVDDAVKAYEMEAQTDPSSVAQAYFNVGAVLTNAGRPDEANAAFDKAIAADPTKAEAYYQKGVNLLGKATLQGDKTIAPPGTAEAFQKYLEIAPTGPNAQSAKDLLTSLGATVETTYGTKKKTTKK